MSEEYRRRLRGIMTGFWSGALDYDQFFSMMMSAIRRGLTRAWNAGLREVGVLPEEQTQAELLALQNIIYKEFSYIDGLAQFIEARRKESGSKLKDALARLDLWIQRELDTQNQAKAIAGKNQKLKWVLGQTEKHCRTCTKLNGKVKRASIWAAAGLRPQSPPNGKLECQGWRCQCYFLPTTERASPGRLPRVP